MGSDLNDLGTRYLGNQLKALTVSSALHFTSIRQLSAPGLEYDKLEMAFPVDWFKKMGAQEKMPNPSLHIDFEPCLSKQNRCLLRRLGFFFLLFLVKIRIHGKILR